MYNDHKFKTLHKILPGTSAYVKTYDGQTKWMYVLIEDDDFSNHAFLAIINLDAVLYKNEKCYQ